MMEVSNNDGSSSFKDAELDLYTIPSKSSWFVWDDIHEIERREFAEFFTERSITRTPKVYKEYRDFIINKYREDASRRLTFTSIRKFLVGDVNLLRKVFLFLENWGLINFLKESDDDDDEEEESEEAKIEQGTPSGIRVTATPLSVRPVTVPPLVEERAEPAFKFSPLTSYSDVFADLKKPCGRCGERRCGSAFYQHSTKSNVTLCDKCFKNGDYGDNNSADDFKLIGSSAAAAWTEEETLLLLESVLKHGDDWELIAQSVSTKTRLDCISKLIELPFGEFLMGSASGRLRSSVPASEDGNLSSPSNKADGQEQKETETTREEKGEDHVVDEDEPPAKRKRVGLTSDGDSSLMKQVAAMACKVGPSVTAAAAKAAIAALCDEASCPKDIFETNGDSAVDRADGDKDTSEQQEDKEETQEDLPVALRMRASVATALGAAAAHAKILADQEEREMELLAASIIDQQLKKMKSKLKFLDHLELIMDAEEQVMEGVKEAILQERISVLQCAFRDGITKRWDNTYVK
ncbi:SWI/SNF complex subunit SWI3A [Hirschfeldia incana]|nr:SWI/SNF complex subunit SWI3A [Hirschfeldia incana]